MSVLRRNRKNKAAAYGMPGSSSSLSNRLPLNKWRKLSLTTKVAVFITVTTAGALVGYAGTGTAIAAAQAAVITASMFLLFLGIIFAAGALSALLVALCTIAFMPLLGSVFTSSAGVYDPLGGALSLFAAYAVAFFIGLRWGRGRGWITVILLSVSLIIPAVPLVMAFPALGLNAARLSLVLVLLLRCGGFTWITGTLGLLYDKIRYGRDDDMVIARSEADPQDVSLAWERQAVAERAAAKALESLPEGYSVFHDVVVPKDNGNVGHVVVGPTGLTLITSVHALGTVYVDKELGLVVPQVDMQAVAWALIQQRLPLAKTLGVHPRDARIMVIVNGNHALERLTVAAVDFDASGRKDTMHLSVCSPDDAVSVITENLIVWSNLKARQVQRRAKMKLVTSTLPQTSAEYIPSTLELTVVDEDGHPAISSTNSPDQPHDWREGDQVSVKTNLGVLNHLRVIKDMTIDDDGHLIVMVCTEDHWNDYKAGELEKESIISYPFPVECVQPAINAA